MEKNICELNNKEKLKAIIEKKSFGLYLVMDKVLGVRTLKLYDCDFKEIL